jgi:hypothetical protein
MLSLGQGSSVSEVIQCFSMQQNQPTVQGVSEHLNVYIFLLVVMTICCGMVDAKPV